MKTKQMKTSAPSFAKGGGNRMAGKGSAGPNPAGTSNPGAGRGGGKFHAGGKTRMAGKGSAKPAKVC